MASAGFDLHQGQAVGPARAADAVALFADCGVGAEPFDDRVQGGDFAAAFVSRPFLITPSASDLHRKGRGRTKSLTPGTLGRQGMSGALVSAESCPC